ncbi:hypothetical protein B0H14DRAFT_2406348 [Mycena olivaceomarginata]|nr:hypothetical protein B0H14DRAFT_2406348 [Mycena olivaceomarginata]
MPLRDAWNAVRDIRTTLHGVQRQFYQALLEEVEATPFLERLQDLINEGADPNAAEFANSFQLAALHGRTDIVKFLLSEIPTDQRVIETKPGKIVAFCHTHHPAHLCSGGTYGTALQAASANGHGATVQLLLDKTTDKEYINIVVGGCYGTALCAACANEKFEVIKLLLDNGARAELDGEWSDVGGVAADVGTGKIFGSPLHVASLLGNTGMITLLLKDVGSEDRNRECQLGGIVG